MTAFRNAVAPEVAADYRARGWWGDVTLLDHVRRHARERPDDAAIIADAGTLSWAAYERAATRVAAALVDASIPEGARVAVILPDSGTVHAVFLGAELAGVTVVGIGARAGDREVRHLLGRTGASALVSLERHRDRETASLLPDWKPEGGAPIRHVVVPRLEVDPDGPITVDGTPAATTVPAEALEARRIGPDDLFLVNSTSGTTGLPKCVMHTQNRWLYFHRQAVRSGHLDADDVVFERGAGALWLRPVDRSLHTGDARRAARRRRTVRCRSQPRPHRSPPGDHARRGEHAVRDDVERAEHWNP